MVLYISKSIAIFIKLNAKWTNNNILFTHKYAGKKNQIKWFMNVWYENHFLMPTKKISLVFHDVSIWINIKQRENKFSLQGKKDWWTYSHGCETEYF